MNVNGFLPCFEGGPSAAEHPVTFAGPTDFAHHYFCRQVSFASVLGHTQQQLAIDIPPLASVDDGRPQIVGKDKHSFYCVVHVISNAWCKH